ncbi:MAG: hypothetical protein JW896_13745 [Deltaproteobacteria bacterium]|nr:hypothetical protein [Deltaproteobacteria bacterium]
MKKWFLRLCLVMQVMMSALVLFSGCDSGEKARDELTGNRALKQYHKSTKDIGKIVDRQTEKYKSVPNDEKEEGNKGTSDQ